MRNRDVEIDRETGCNGILVAALLQRWIDEGKAEIDVM
jgi:hypothetical protein